MARAVTGAVLRQIESLFEGNSVAGLTDRQFLERFNARRDSAGEAAFAALVTRHGPMVLDVCRQIVSDSHHAEDVFQAVFLVLARKAPSIGNPDLLSNWLYGVALRTARKAKARLARLHKHEEGGVHATSRFGAEPRDRATGPGPRGCGGARMTRSAGCRGRFVSRWFSAISRDSLWTRPPTGSDARPARCVADWHGHVTSSAAA